MLRRILCMLFVAIMAAGCGTTGKNFIAEHSGDDYHDFLYANGNPNIQKWALNQSVRASMELVKHPAFSRSLRVLEAMLSDENGIKYPKLLRDGYLYRFWQTTEILKGQIQRCLPEKYLEDRCNWEVVVDFDAMSVLPKKYGPDFKVGQSLRFNSDFSRLLVNVYPTGNDHLVLLELDVQTGQFIPEEDGGFAINEAGRTTTYWNGDDTVLVATNVMGRPASPESGYPLTVVRWQRGTPFAEAAEIFRASNDHVGIDDTILSTGEKLLVFEDAENAINQQLYVLLGDGTIQKIDIPASVHVVDFHEGSRFAVLNVEKDWHTQTATYLAGDVVLYEVETGQKHLVWRPAANQTANLYNMVLSMGPGRMVLHILEDVKSVLLFATYEGGSWQTERLPSPENAMLWMVNPDVEAQAFMVSHESLAQALIFSVYDLETREMLPIKHELQVLNSEEYTVTQRFAPSFDGVQIPYFMVHHKDLVLDGSNCTLIYGYGGFAVPEWPFYTKSIIPWLQEGCVYVLANVRGGGEYGPKWHEAAQKENKPVTYKDVVATAEDLIRLGITSPEHLGLRGGSNGGLVMCGTAMLRPDLFGAVVCDVPLLNLLEYIDVAEQSGGGSNSALWTYELGDPRIPEEREAMRSFSPYHMMVCGDPLTSYPPILLVTNLDENRVPVGHSLQFAARGLDCGLSVTLLVEQNGGHSSGSDPKRRAHSQALSHVWLLERLQ